MLAKLTTIYRDAKGRFQKASKAMAEAWTDKGDGTQYPEGAENSAHSGDYDTQQTAEMQHQEVEIPPHDHVWQKGIIPTGEVRICKICGETEKV